MDSWQHEFPSNYLTPKPPKKKWKWNPKKRRATVPVHRKKYLVLKKSAKEASQSFMTCKFNQPLPGSNIPPQKPAEKLETPNTSPIASGDMAVEALALWDDENIS